MNKTVREALCNALDDLLEDQFRRFKWMLPATTDCDGQRKIPMGKLEKADKQCVVDLMCGFYGEDRASQICIHVLEKINVRDVATKLKEETQNDFGPHQVPAISDYRNHIKTKFQTMKDPNSLPGEYVHLNQRYSKLIIIDYHRPEKEREYEIMASGGRHTEIMEKRDSSSIAIEDLFKSDEYDLIPKVVVLQGAAGIGKTMTARKIMFDWACGQLFQDMFDFAFYIHCREMNLCTDEKSIMEIILPPWPNQHAAKEILRNPQKLLFIIDGFDELRFSFDQPEDCLCTDPYKKESVGVLLSSLFRKKVLPKSYLIVTTRPTALEKLRQCLECSRYVEILGFSVEEREEFFHKFLKNKKQATQAFQIVKQNANLFTMCLIPLVCWIICTMMKEQIENGEDLEQRSNTLTAVYVQYLYSLLRFHHGKPKQDMQRSLKSLCLLAADGIWKQKILFDKEEISKYNLDQEDSFPLFLNENIFKKYLDCICTYSFIHLSFQEFFAALYYALEGDIQQTSQTPDVRTLLETYKTSRFDLEVTVRFLFGLLNESERMKELKETLGLKISPELKKALLEWVKSMTKEKTMDKHIFQNLYESQDENFVNYALDITTLSIYPTNEMEVIAVTYCLECCCSLEHLHFDGVLYRPVMGTFYGSLAKILYQNQGLKQLELIDSEIGDTEMKLLCEGLKQPECKLKYLRLNDCRLRGAYCGDLAHVLNGNQSLKELDLSFNKIEDEGMKVLCKRLKYPNCKLEKLWASGCYLTAACCGDLAQVLRESWSLNELDVSYNKIKDTGMKLLCKSLKHPACKLEKLRVSLCHLTADCCGDLAQVLRESQSLKELNLSINSIEDTGVKLLCEGLKYPDCKLEKLSLASCHLTAAGWEDLCAALDTNQSLIHLYVGVAVLENPDALKYRCWKYSQLARIGGDKADEDFELYYRGAHSETTRMREGMSDKDLQRGVHSETIRIRGDMADEDLKWWKYSQPGRTGGDKVDEDFKQWVRNKKKSTGGEKAEGFLTRWCNYL